MVSVNEYALNPDKCNVPANSDELRLIHEDHCLLCALLSNPCLYPDIATSMSSADRL